MAPDFKSWLATQVIAEKQTVSYRNVARAFKVHVNAAKCMLYDFYQNETKKRPSSIYATYLLAGVKRRAESSSLGNGNLAHDANNDEDDDDPMPSSPPLHFTSSMLEPSQQSDSGEHKQSYVPVKTISLVREEALEASKQQFEMITSIHIYSLSPGRLPDLVALTDIGRGIWMDTFLKEDPITNYKTYGIIQNPYVKRRTGKRPIVKDAPPSKFQPTKAEAKVPGDMKSSTAATAAPKEESRPTSRDSSSSNARTSSLKRDGSNLFKAFAKQTGKSKPGLRRQDTGASASGAEDVKMTEADDDDDEGESEDEALFLDTNTRSSGTRTKKRISDVKKEREDKTAKLRKMMDSDDDEDNGEETPTGDYPSSGDAAQESHLQATKEIDVQGHNAAAQQGNPDVDWSDSDNDKDDQTRQPREGAVAVGAVAPKRRRGKRKVMKKRTMKDEDGYLVTKEEAVWESFSEDDDDNGTNKGNNGPASASQDQKKKAIGGSQSQSQSQQQKQIPAIANAKASAKKKGGGGDIMSFFGKK